MIKIPFKTILSYSLGNLSFGIVVQIISSFLTFFGTSVLGISGTLMGAMMSVSVIWDALTDPLMGYISDNTKSKRFGKRHGYILSGAILMAMSTIWLWSVRPEYSMGAKITIIFCGLMLCKTFSTVFATPYSALGAELSHDYDERTKIQATKSVFFLIGLAMPTVLGMYIFFRPTARYPLGQLNPDVYFPLGMATAAVAVISAIPCLMTTWNYRTADTNAKRAKFSYRSMLLDMISPIYNNDSRYVILGYLTQNIASAIVMTLNMHVFTYTFHLNNSSISMIMGIMLFASVAAQPFWVERTAQKDKKRAMIESCVIAVIGASVFGAMVILRNQVSGVGWTFVPFSVITGFALGGMVSIPQTMLIDTIDVDEYRTGKRKEGSIFGCMTFFYKLSQAITMFVLGLYLDLIGFDASIGMQTDKIEALLGYSMPIGLLISLFITIYFFSKYSLNKEKVLEIQTKLRQNHAE